MMIDHWFSSNVLVNYTKYHHGVRHLNMVSIIKLSKFKLGVKSGYSNSLSMHVLDIV